MPNIQPYSTTRAPRSYPSSRHPSMLRGAADGAHGGPEVHCPQDTEISRSSPLHWSRLDVQHFSTHGISRRLVVHGPTQPKQGCTLGCMSTSPVKRHAPCCCMHSAALPANLSDVDRAVQVISLSHEGAVGCLRLGNPGRAAAHVGVVLCARRIAAPSTKEPPLTPVIPMARRPRSETHPRNRDAESFAVKVAALHRQRRTRWMRRRIADILVSQWAERLRNEATRFLAQDAVPPTSATLGIAELWRRAISDACKIRRTMVIPDEALTTSRRTPSGWWQSREPLSRQNSLRRRPCRVCPEAPCASVHHRVLCGRLSTVPSSIERLFARRARS